MNAHIEAQLKIGIHEVIMRAADSLDVDYLELFDLVKIENPSDDNILDIAPEEYITAIRIMHPLLRGMIEDLSPELINALGNQIDQELQA